jgi:hypothetical protein
VLSHRSSLLGEVCHRTKLAQEHYNNRCGILLNKAINPNERRSRLDQVINAIGENACAFFYEIGGDSVADFMQCPYGTDYVTSGWYVVIGIFVVFSGGGFFFFGRE